MTMLARLRQLRWQATHQTQGVSAAFLAAIVLGLAPVFGKQAITAGAEWPAVVMLRTVFAAAILWTLYILIPKLRPYLYIYPVGLVGCILAGGINGLGSLFYYSGLGKLDASLAQLLYTLYPLFLTLFSHLDGYPISRFTSFRLGLALLAVYLLTRTGAERVDLVGALFMLMGGAFYAIHVALNQRILYDVPSPTVAVYNLTSMAVVVSVAYGAMWLTSGGAPKLPPNFDAWQGVILLTITTAISRLTLFMGVKRLGGVQAAIIGLSELIITIPAARILLHEELTISQWVGTALLTIAVILVIREKSLGDIPQPKPWYWFQDFVSRFTPTPEFHPPREPKP